ncbi:hypothetical protein DL766_003084 [Monosporascus sp. MC13-8B]|uniref:Holocytochrome c-type synthase n=1 Tax=Monosporascus cannonballus TaxID=155416 RepID=A0ABY0GS55_9PEZI|nr:hypothetical protein DL762_010157 [Monosporascus cannonballus]RYP34267.1 hypothetical protein DL766_003084 [Monosporascus sp. MC13-8B]
MQSQGQQSATCPVDHRSREAWPTQARAAATATSGTDTPQSPSQSQSLPPAHPPLPADSSTGSRGAAGGAESCPVDHRAREIWLQQARAAGASPSEISRPYAHHAATATAATITAPRASPSPSSSWTSYLPRLPPLWASPPPSSITSAPKAALDANDSDNPLATLGTEREVSTIPRTATSSYPASYSAAASAPLPPAASSSSTTAPTTTPSPLGTTASHGAPANSEQETGADAASGNWIYPSERMFFEAMRRKGHDPRAPDMRAVVPIHNAVNERAWAEIKAWEGPWVRGTSCSGPRLDSFSGLAGRMSPRARVNGLLGYAPPFDRHDWVVDRCGTRVEYVIDFYAGRRDSAAAAAGKPLSFYLDVRPKLNSWEGVKMRVCRALGVV